MNFILKKLKNLVNFFPELILFLVLILISFSIFNYEENFSNYLFAENLINYEGGFIRRGLLGSIAYFFYQSLDVNPKLFFLIIYYFLYLILIFIFFYFINSLKKENFYLSTILIISPATLFFIIFDNESLFRKEYFLF